MGTGTENYCLPTLLAEQNLDRVSFSLVANNGFLVNISKFDGSSDIVLSYTFVAGVAGPTNLNNSCIREDGTVEINTTNVDFNDLVNMSLTLEVQGMSFAIKYCKYVSFTHSHSHFLHTHFTYM